jgi:PAS domain S-box-containing protein
MKTQTDRSPRPAPAFGGDPPRTLPTVWLVLSAVLLTLVIVTLCGWLFRGGFAPDYLMTGGIAASLVAPCMFWLQKRLLARQYRHYLEREGLYRAMVNQAGDGMDLIDAATLQIVEINETACRLLGYAREEYLKLRLTDVQAEWSEAEIRAMIPGLLARGGASFESRHRRKDGSTLNVQMSVRPFRLDGRDYLVGIWRDITQRARDEAALRRSEENLKRAQTVAHIGSWLLDIPNNTLEWSDETYRLFGIAPGTPLTLDTFAACIHPADAEPVLAAWNAALQGAPYDIEHRIQVDGATRWVRERAELSFSPEGQPLLGIGTTQDITERVQAETALKESHALLQTVIETLPLRVFWKDRDSRYLGCNTLFARDSGQDRPEDVVGKGDSQLVWHDQAHLYRADDCRVMETGLPNSTLSD